MDILLELENLCSLVVNNNQLESLPSFIGDLSQINYLVASHNNLKSLPDSLSKNFRLEEIVLSHNRITKFPDSFQMGNFQSIIRIDAYSNELTLNDNIFEGAENCALEEVNFGRNKITKLPENFFELRNLSVCSFKCNSISEISPKISNLQILTILDLSSNNISELPNEFYESCLDISTLNLYGNKISSLPDNFRNLTRLRQIYLGYNNITSFPFLDDCYFGYLEELFLNGNPISQIPENIVDNAGSLRYLYLNNMKLKSIPHQIGQLAYLEQLDVSHNQLTTIPHELSNLQSIYSLDFSHNQITNTSGGDPDTSWDRCQWSSQVTGIEIFDLSFNKISSFPEGLKGYDKERVHIILDGNPVEPVKPSLTATFSSGWSELVGKRPSQEDALSIAGKIGEYKLNGFNDDIYLYALFDGHCGKSVAHFSAKHFVTHLLKALSDKNNKPEKALSDTFFTINQQLIDESNTTNPSLKHCGCTAVVTMIIGNYLFVGNVGDARAVMFVGDNYKFSAQDLNSNDVKNDDFSSRKITMKMEYGGNSQKFDCEANKVVRLSYDHKPDDEDERIRNAGGYVIKSRVDGVLGVARSIGDITVPPITCLPYVATYAIPQVDDVFILMCCDGVWDELSDIEACSLARNMLKSKNNNLYQICNVIRDSAFFLGSEDNISVMLIKKS
eukprot:TRINITY_DN3943_c3_g1_i1.p1 TRINITY_DN3943_c3_g1~~TRINITY_DN3943_c3_g1_i1.p1  ORF type:complete len:673 (-),score=135.87 TRINITY_DN3943_c3_g1_i1:54-2072(-)